MVSDAETISDAKIYEPPMRRDAEVSYLTGFVKKEFVILLPDTEFLSEAEGLDFLLSVPAKSDNQ